MLYYLKSHSPDSESVMDYWAVGFNKEHRWKSNKTPTTNKAITEN